MITTKHLIKLSGEEHLEEVVEYGLEALAEGIITAMVIVIAGVFAGRFLESVIFITFSMMGTATMGGYHCNTRERCLAFTIFLWVLAIYGADILSAYTSDFMLAVMLFYSLTCVVKYAPVEHKNKPLMQTVRRKNRIQAIILDLAVTIMIIVFWRIERNLAGVFLINKLEVIISMLIGKEDMRHVQEKKCADDHSDC